MSTIHRPIRGYWVHLDTATGNAKEPLTPALSPSEGAREMVAIFKMRPRPLLRLFVNGQRLEFHLACRIFFQLLNLYLRFGQLILTHFGQVRAFRVLT